MKGATGARSHAPASAGAAAPRSGRPRRRLAHVVGAITVGLVFGVFVGLNLRSPPDPAPLPLVLPATATPTASASSSPQPAARRSPAVEIDLGSAEAAPKLKGPWDAKAVVDDRSAAVTSGPSGQILLEGDPAGGAKLVALVARAVNIEADQAVTLAASTGGKEVARWTVSAEWSLYAGPWPSSAPFASGALLDLALEGTEEVQRPKGDPPGVALDYLQVLTPADRESLDLGTAPGCARLLEGFWEVEQNALGNRPAAWSRGDHSRLGLLLAPTAGNYALRLRVGPFVPIAPVEVKVLVNGKPAAVQSIDGLNDYVLTISRALLVDGANMLELQYSKTARPADHGGEDTRQLAMRLFGIGLEPAAP